MLSIDNLKLVLAQLSKTPLNKLLTPSIILPNLFAGLTSGLVTLTYNLSFAALVFSGILSPFFSQGIGIILIGSIVTGIVVTLGSSFPFAIGAPDSNSIVILAVMTTAIAQELQRNGQMNSLFPTVWAAIAFSSLFIGLSLYGIGKLHFGRWARFVPYPVAGGFLAATGWLLTHSSFQLMAGVPLELGEISRLFHRNVLVHWVIGIGFAGTLIVLTKRFRQAFVLPVTLIGGMLLFNLCWRSINLFFSLDPKGWFFEPFSRQKLWQAWQVETLNHIDWMILVGHLDTLLAMMIVVIIAILFNATGIELATQCDSNLDSELQTNGIANFLTGLSGGMMGYLTINRTLINYNAGGDKRLSGLVSVLICGSILLIGSDFLAYVPRPILGGLLFANGFKLLLEWLYNSKFRLSRLEYLLVLSIVATVILVGFVQGILVGVLFACLLFVINYSQYNVVRYAVSGRDQTSNFKRAYNLQKLLYEQGEQIYILQLQGYIFFGTSENLLVQIHDRLSNSSLSILKFLILDFRLVSALDASAILSFIKLKQIAHQCQFAVVFTNLDQPMQKQLEQAGCIASEDPICHVLPELDRGIEWCENQILDAVSLKRKRFVPLVLQLKRFFPDGDDASILVNFMERIQVPAGYSLFSQGDQPNSLFLIEAGQVTEFLVLKDNQTKRLRTVSAGNMVGERALYSNSPYASSVFTDQPCTIYRLSTEALIQMEREYCATAIAFHKFVLKTIAEQLNYREIELRHLLQ